MLNSDEQSELALSIIVTVVGGEEFVHRCLDILSRQVNFADTEIIVPYDRWSANVGKLTKDFPRVNFHFINDLGAATSEKVSSHQHRLYDRRRAVGISLARGRVIAMTEDYAVPAEDWCSQVISVHKQPYAAIGGAIDNEEDRPLNWALYYCDFGRYGTPLLPGTTEYASDVNIAYKRAALKSISNAWENAYHETLVHWTLRSRGETVFLDPRMLVRERRPRIRFSAAFRERIEWGRVFAETRVAACSRWQRISYAAGAVLLPFLLMGRVCKHMKRQRRSFKQMITTLPLAACLLFGWSLGEFTGYLFGPVPEEYLLTKAVTET
jgi:hypothetical protein